MTTEEKQQLDNLQKAFDSLKDYSLIPLELENALIARGFTKTTPVTGLAGTSTVYVASSSGGAVTTAITFTKGIRTS